MIEAELDGGDSHAALAVLRLMETAAVTVELRVGPQEPQAALDQVAQALSLSVLDESIDEARRQQLDLFPDLGWRRKRAVGYLLDTLARYK